VLPFLRERLAGRNNLRHAHPLLLSTDPASAIFMGLLI
jgi:hypothetical protein